MVAESKAKPMAENSEREKNTLAKRMGNELNLSGINYIVTDRQPIARRWDSQLSR